MQAYGVADYLILSKHCDLQALNHLLRMGRLVVSISNLVHRLQRERGASNVYVGSSGSRFAQEREQAVTDSVEAERFFRHCLQEISGEEACSPSGSRLFNGIAYAIQGLDELRSVRTRIKQLEMSTDAVIDGYSELIRGLLAVVFEAADAAADPDVSRVLVAMFHLMQGKELAGQERAVGAAGFARGGFNAAMAERFRHLIEHQERYFQIFRNFADEKSLMVWYRTVSDDVCAELERLRRVAIMSASDGRADQALSDAWFEQASLRIDNLKAVEDQLEAALMELCQRKIQTAEKDLTNHRSHLEAMASQPADHGTYAVFFNEDGAAAEDYVGSQLGRSLVELVQEQSKRLQSMSEELTEARAALTERKTIEKAKGLIMKYRRMSEEDAYKFMREVAMSQRRKLSEVAADTINMVELLREKEKAGD